MRDHAVCPVCNTSVEVVMSAFPEGTQIHCLTCRAEVTPLRQFPPPSEEEIAAEIRAMRAERRKR